MERGSSREKTILCEWLITYKGKRKVDWVFEIFLSSTRLFFSKWNWCYACKSESLWKWLVIGNFGEEEGWFYGRFIEGNQEKVGCYQ